MVVVGPCWVCKLPFSFDPERVQAVPVDPETQKTPDLGGDASRAVNEPVCPSCCKRANPGRRKLGLPEWSEEDTGRTLLYGRHG